MGRYESWKSDGEKFKEKHKKNKAIIEEDIARSFPWRQNFLAAIYAAQPPDLSSYVIKIWAQSKGRELTSGSNDVIFLRPLEEIYWIHNTALEELYDDSILQSYAPVQNECAAILSSIACGGAGISKKQAEQFMSTTTNVAIFQTVTASNGELKPILKHLHELDYASVNTLSSSFPLSHLILDRVG